METEFKITFFCVEVVEGFRKKNAILHAELVKARAKIQRLEKKLALKPILKEE